MPPFLLVLGVAQDGGHPQPGCTRACCMNLAALPAKERAKVRFTHRNHTNPILNSASPEAENVVAAGMAVAREGERVNL